MKVSWTKGVTSEEIKKAIILEYKQSPTMRRKLREIIAEKREKAYDENVKEVNYESPNWAFKQADHVGYMRGLKEIYDFLEDS